MYFESWKYISTFSTSGHLSVQSMLYSRYSDPNRALLTHKKKFACMYAVTISLYGSAPQSLRRIAVSTHLPLSRSHPFELKFELRLNLTASARISPISGQFFPFYSIYIIYFTFCFHICYGEGEKWKFISIFDRASRTVKFPIGFVQVANLAFTILSPPPLSPPSAFLGLVWLRLASPVPFSRRFWVCSKIPYNHGKF